MQNFRELTSLQTHCSTEQGQDDVWSVMCKKNTLYERCPDYLSQHGSLKERMRAVVLDWLAEVCQYLKFHRETYYLAIDYIDRYLTHTENFPKQQLQLLGITCLFVAAKIEEINPRELSEFAYLTDETCSVNEILKAEEVLLQKLNWNLTPITSINWVKTYLLLAKEFPQESVTSTEANSDDYTHVQIFVQVARLLDLCTLDISSLNYTSRMIAATAMCYITSPQLATKVSQYSLQDLKECYDWMAAFACTVQEMGPNILPSFNHVSQDDIHNIQTHSVDLDILGQAQAKLNPIRSASSGQNLDMTGSSPYITSKNEY